MNCEYPYCTKQVFAIIELQHIPSDNSVDDKYSCVHHLADFVIYLLFHGITKYSSTEVKVIIRPVREE